MDVCDAQTGPIFLAYRSQKALKRLTADEKQKEPLFDFVSEDGIRHRGWKIAGQQELQAIQTAFSGMDSLYIADGHHRAASAVRVGLKRREEHPGYTGDEEFNYFLSVIFPDDELMIMDYNRVVKDLNGLTPEQFLDKVREVYEVRKSDKAVHPQKKGQAALYLENQWYLLALKPQYETTIRWRAWTYPSSRSRFWIRCSESGIQRPISGLISWEESGDFPSWNAGYIRI